jgi:hypothetical protein
MRLPVALALVLGSSISLAAEPIAIGSRLELFVDDYLIDKMTGDVRQYVHRPEPKEVVLVTGQPWEGNTCAYYTIFQDGDRYRMYYRGSHADEKTQRSLHAEVTCYAESRDGIHFTKPQLGLYDWEGSKANNIIWTGIGTHNFTPFLDANPNCSADSRYKAIAGGQPPGKRGLHVFQSADGIHWSMIHDEPVITQGAFDSQNLAFWDPIRKRYVDYHRTFVDGVRAIMTCTSPDFINWTEPVLLNYPDAPQQHLYTNAIRPYPRAPHIKVGFPTRYLPAQSQVEPIFMSSRDGVTFHRWNDPVIPRTAPQDRDGNRSNYLANGLVQLPNNDREYAVYATEAYYRGPDSRIRRFMYRIDGFVSVRGDDKGGQLTTRPLTFTGDSLVVNFATQDSGRIELDLLDERDAVLASAVLTGDEIAHAVSWESGKTLDKLAGKPVRLRFGINKADVYSIRFVPSGQSIE